MISGNGAPGSKITYNTDRSPIVQMASHQVPYKPTALSEYVRSRKICLKEYRDLPVPAFSGERIFLLLQFK